VSDRVLRLTAVDRTWQEALFTHVAEVFPGIDFHRWAALGGWTVDYEVLVVIEDGQLVASVGCSRMPVIIGGRERSALQLGAVATRASHRGRGLARLLMKSALAEADRRSEPVFLFANPNVLTFYPRFGFRRVVQSRFGAEVTITSAARHAQPFDVADARARQRLAELCGRAPPTGRRFGARSYYSILLWHLCNRPLTAQWLEAEDALVVSAVENDRLILYDVVSPHAFDLAATLPAVVARPIAGVEFGFEPGAWWPDARPLGPDDALLFVRGADDLLQGPVRFPDLAQT
jgi:predicted N-acetyltransferase YhbS